MKMFKKNMTAIEKRYSKLAEEIGLLDMDELESRIGMECLQNGLVVPKVARQGRWWRLNSCINPEFAAMCYGERYPARPYEVYLVFGFADGRHIRHILSQCDDTNQLVVCVPDIGLFACVCHSLDISDLIEDERIFLYVPEVEENITDILNRVIWYSNMNLLEFCILPGYDVLYTRSCQLFMDEAIEKIQMEAVHKGTRLGFDRMIPRHMLFHMKNLIYQRNIEQIRVALEPYDLTKIPAIIVSAGPSLDKNVSELVKAQGKSFIIVVDAALRTVLRAGVRPDAVCTIDPESPDRFFDDLDLSGVLWFTGRLTRPEVMKRYGDKVFYEGGFTRGWNDELSRELGYTFPELPSGGCVTAQAFLTVQYLGFQKMVLIGQDMAFTGGVSHTSGIEGALGDNDEYIQSRLLMQVEGVDGTILETDFQMWFYRQWFEKTIRVGKGFFEVIDATEGGARIEGTVIQTLKETIEKECVEEIPIYEIEREIPPVFSKEQQETLYKKICSLKQDVICFRENVKEMAVRQEQLLAEAKAGACGHDFLRKSLEEITEMNERVNKEDMLALLIYYAQEEEYEIGGSIYVAENLEVVDLIEKTLVLYRGYCKGLELLEEDIDEYVIKD